MQPLQPFNYYVPRLTNGTTPYPTTNYEEIYKKHQAAIDTLLHDNAPILGRIDVHWIAEAGNNLYGLFYTTLVPQDERGSLLTIKSAYPELVEALYNNPLLRIKEVATFYAPEAISSDDNTSAWSCESFQEAFERANI